MFPDKDFPFLPSVIVSIVCVNISGICMLLSFIFAFTFPVMLWSPMPFMFFCFFIGFLFKKHVEYHIKKESKEQGVESFDINYVSGFFYLNCATYFLIFILLSIQFFWNINYIIQSPLTYLILLLFSLSLIKGLFHVFKARKN